MGAKELPELIPLQLHVVAEQGECAVAHAELAAKGLVEDMEVSLLITDHIPLRGMLPAK